MNRVQPAEANGEWRRMRRLVAYGVVALLVLVGLAIAVSVYFRGAQPEAFFLPFGFGWLWLIFGIFFLSWVLCWVYWRPYHRRQLRWEPEGAILILQERYARGEITKEQFDQMLRDLRQTQGDA